MTENPKNVKIKIQDDNCFINSDELYQKNNELINDSKSNILLNIDKNGDMEEISLSLSDSLEDDTNKELEMLFLCNHDSYSIDNVINFKKEKKYSKTNIDDNYLKNLRQNGLDHKNINNKKSFMYKNDLLKKKKKLSLQLMSNIFNKKYDINKKNNKTFVINLRKKNNLTNNRNSNYYFNNKGIKNINDISYIIKNKTNFQKLSNYNYYYNNDFFRKMNEHKQNTLFSKKRSCSNSIT